MNIPGVDMPSQAYIDQPRVQPSLEQRATMPTLQESPPKHSAKFFLVLFLIFLLLVGGGVAGYFSLQKSKSGGAVSEIDGGSTDVLQSSGSVTQCIGESQEVVLQPVPHYVGNQTITLHNVTGENYSGTAIRSISPYNIFYAVYTNLPDPSEGMFYQVWRVKADVQSVNRLYKFTDGSYTMTAHERLDSSSLSSRRFDDFYNTLFVSLEASDDEFMETKILEGTFTQ